METRSIKQSEDIKLYACTYIYTDMSLYLCACVPILGPFVFRLIKPSCLQRKGEGADTRARSSCFKVLKGRDAISVEKFDTRNSGSPKDA